MAGMGHEDIDKIAALISISAKYTILMVEHNLSVVANLSDIITVLTRGQVLAEGNTPTPSRTSASRKPIWGRSQLIENGRGHHCEIRNRIRHAGAVG
jgi:branched-chain amino acid transport system ATP-binding protein